MTAVSRRVAASQITPGTVGQRLVTYQSTTQWATDNDIDARWYGVVADNSTDCTSALQAALTAGAALGTGQARGGNVVLPKGQILVNCGQIAIPDCVSLRGQGPTRTFLKAKASATTGSWVVRLGNGSGICFRNVVQDMTIDASNTTTTTGVYTSEAQEGCGIRNCVIIGFTNHGAHWDGTPSLTGGTGPPENSFMEYVEVYGKNTSTEAIFIDTCGEKIGVKYVTIRPDGAIGGHGALVIRKSNVDAQWIHPESHPQGVLFQTGGRGTLNQINGNSDITDCVHMNNDANTTGIVCLNIDKNGGTNSIVDGRHNGYTHPDAQVALYSPEAGVPFKKAGTPEASITAPVGMLCINTSGGAGTTLYVKESGTGNTGWIGK